MKDGGDVVTRLQFTGQVNTIGSLATEQPPPHTLRPRPCLSSLSQTETQRSLCSSGLGSSGAG